MNMMEAGFTSESCWPNCRQSAERLGRTRVLVGTETTRKRTSHKACDMWTAPHDCSQTHSPPSHTTQWHKNTLSKHMKLMSR